GGRDAVRRAVVGGADSRGDLLPAPGGRRQRVRGRRAAGRGQAAGIAPAIPPVAGRTRVLVVTFGTLNREGAWTSVRRSFSRITRWGRASSAGPWSSAGSDRCGRRSTRTSRCHAARRFRRVAGCRRGTTT